MKNSLEVSLVLESYNHSEGADIEHLRLALQTATNMIMEQGRGQVLLTDTGGSSDVAALLAQDFPNVLRIDAVGQDYDGAKALAAANAAGQYVLYLDGDCLPQPGWSEFLLGPLRAGKAVAVGGFTRYEGGFLAAVLTVMDFGFLLPCKERILQCYASNNSGFRRDLLTDVPVPEGPMRCLCYSHAQLLLRQNSPVIMVPDAIVHHALPPFFSERFRRGYDDVAACWIDPNLSETSWLGLGLLAAPIFYARNIWLDWQRVLQGYRVLDLGFWQVLLTLPLFPLLRLVDLAGTFRALSSSRQPNSSQLGAGA